MGTINTIWDPKYWKVCFEGKSKLTEGDVIYNMIIGDGEDYQYYEITEFISKDNYDKVIKGTYFVKCFPYSDLSILLFNEQKELIPLVIGNNINYDKLSKVQKEYINSLQEKTLLKRAIKKQS